MFKAAHIPHNQIFIQNLDEVVEQYKAGVSINTLSKRNGISRPAMTRLIKSTNTKMRSQSETELIKWQGMTDEQKQKQVCNAHAKVKGQKRRIEELELRAKSAYKNPFKTGNFEAELSALLSTHFKTEKQFPFYKYNIDIALPDLKIAIEIQSSNQHLINKPFNIERSKYICGQGWFLIYVIFTQCKTGGNVRNISNGILKECKLLKNNNRIKNSYGFLNMDGGYYNSVRYDIPGLIRIF